RRARWAYLWRASSRARLASAAAPRTPTRRRHGVEFPQSEQAKHRSVAGLPAQRGGGGLPVLVPARAAATLHRLTAGLAGIVRRAIPGSPAFRPWDSGRRSG